MRWTESQREAIEARNDSVLVSAAAGSGKTAVLVERVLSLLREGGRIDRMLIVTFTRAAAGEMRERIGRRLEEEGEGSAHLRRQGMLLSRAMICTLHVFCNRVLREHFEAAGIDPLCRIADEDKLAALRTRALDEIMEEAYAAPGEDEQALFLQFEDQQITALIDDVYPFLMAQEDPWGWAERQGEETPMGKWLALLYGSCAHHLEGAYELLDEMEKLLQRPDGPSRYAPMFDSDSAITAKLMEDAKNGTITGGKTSCDRLSTKKAPANEDPALAERYKALRKEWKERVDKARGLLPTDAEQAEKDVRHTLPALRALLGLTKKLHERYFSFKQAKNYLDYNDLEHLTLKALQSPEVRSRVSGQYDALFIDEYQDVSGIQEAILRALHEPGKNTLFMVGDVKQSIYRFRLADPTLFLRKYREYADAKDAPCRRILLQQNFRSDENILLAVNQVFAHAMRERETEIAYDEGAMLRPGGNCAPGAAVEVHLMTAEDEAGEGELKQGYRWEAAFAARRIRELVRTGTVREGESTRPLQYRDIALLLRSASGRAPYIARALQMAGIPVYSDADAQFFDLPEVVDLMNLLRVIDNPLQDIPLLSALRCPCFGFAEEELARIRLVERTPGTPFSFAFRKMLEKEGPLAEKARTVWETLGRWRFLAANLPVDSLIWRVLSESGLYMRAGAMEDGELRQANLRLLAERAQGESAREGLSAFLRETGRLHGSDDSKTAKTLGENENVVRILTLHKSKGLQFPVVIMMETSRAFHKSSGEESLLKMHAAHGAALKYIDGERRVTRDTCALNALGSVSEKEARAEEARLLYVGMTRAQQRLILLGSPRSLAREKEKWARPASAYAAGEAACMLDWVMTGIGGFVPGQRVTDNGSVWQLYAQPVSEMTAAPVEKAIPVPPLLNAEADETTRARMERKIVPGPPLKTSVTAIAKRLRDERDDWESPADKRAPRIEITVPDFIAGQDKPDPARRGTLTHRVLGLIDYAFIRQGKYAEALNALREKGLLTEEEQREVRLSWLRGFFDSPLGQRALNAREVRREWAFNYRAPGRTLVQGVIDLCFREGGGWVLADYKTDNATPAELMERYALQLRWYARALEKITGLPVRECVLFSLRAGEALPVPLTEDALMSGKENMIPD